MLTEEKGFRNSGLKNLKRDVLQFIADDVRRIIYLIEPSKLFSVEEIRLRAGKPLMIHNCLGDWFVLKDGTLDRNHENTFVVKQADIFKTLELMSENSVYAYQDEIRNGFITIKGGHRIGISGRVVADSMSVKNLKDISGLNIRIAREVPGCSKEVMKYIIHDEKGLLNTLIISPPQCGKTTMLRDIARNLSSGMPEYGFAGLNVGIVDERSEISACYKGIPQNDVGIRTDILDACPKTIGMDMMIRSMSPRVIITDEIGGTGDRDAVMKVINAGIKIITTAHGYNVSEMKSRQEVLSMMKNGVFERLIVLSSRKGPGTLEEIVDGRDMQLIYKGG